MTIDEAIEEEKFLAARYQKDGAFDSAVAHAKIADMLRMVRGADESVQRFTTRICELEQENKKLRELVDAWMGCGTRYHTMKGACPMFDENAKDFCKAEKMARELGIEVRV